LCHEGVISILNLLIAKNKSDPEEYHVGLSDWKTTMNTEPTSTTSTSSTTIESPMETNPPSITKLPIWKETTDISIAKSRKIRGGNFVQIATVDPQTLEPRCRTVVFRGFLPDPPTNDTTTSTDNPTNSNNNFIMKMITDKRSSKVSEIMSHATPPKAELVWWFSKSSEQYRILGDLHFVGGSGSGSGSIGTGAGGDSTKNNGFTLPFDDNEYYSQARKQQWGNLSDAAREQFYWNDPNTHYEIQAKVPVGGRDENGKVLPPPDTFLLMLLFPKRVDYLRLTDNYRQLDELRKDYEWIPHRINP